VTRGPEREVLSKPDERTPYIGAGTGAGIDLMLQEGLRRRRACMEHLLRRAVLGQYNASVQLRSRLARGLPGRVFVFSAQQAP
jgi:hypothetical protein